MIRALFLLIWLICPILCGNTAVCPIKNDGDLGREMREQGKRDIVKNVARSMLAVGLVQVIIVISNLAE